MSGSKKQAESTRRNQGEDFHARIGAKGGSAKTERTKLKGSASLSPEKRREIAMLGVAARWKK
jgi:hypothetical protein